MPDRRFSTGVVVGLALAAIFVGTGGHLPALPTLSAGPVHGPVLSDSEGAMREVVIQYVPESVGMVERAYRDFLGQLPRDVTVYAVCPDQAAFDDLCVRLGGDECRLLPVIVGHEMTTWSRDRWLALGASDGRATLLSPMFEDAAAIWPARAGDSRIGDDLAAALGVRSLRSHLEFDGGDFVADRETVFVTPRVAQRNVPHRVTRQGLAEEMERTLQRRVVLLDEAPDHHAGMFMTLIGNRTALVGDPSLGRALLTPRLRKRAYDLSPETQRLFDAVAQQVAAAGYRVVRMPVLPGRDGRAYETPLNVIMDERAGSRVVYVPTYRHNEPLNRAAAEIWRELGFVVRPVDCTDAYVHSGSLRCLVNVLRRSLAPSARDTV